MPDNIEIKKHSRAETILFHLVPGLINLTVIILLLPLTRRFGWISLTAGYLMIPIAMLPVQLGTLFYIAKKATGTYNILELIPFRQKSRVIEYLIFVVVIVAWAVLVGRILEPLENNVRDSLFSFVPDNIAMRNIELTAFSKGSLIFTAILGVVANGIIAPIIEELYFRGYLMPRINLPPIGAVATSAALFSLYHFFSPWYFFNRLLMMLPIYYWVIKRKNIKFSLTAHIIANLYSSMSILIMVLAL